MEGLEADVSGFEEKIKEMPTLELLVFWPKFFKTESLDTIDTLLSSSRVFGKIRMKLSVNALRNLLLQIYLSYDEDIHHCKRILEDKVKALWDKCGECMFILVEPDSNFEGRESVSRFVQLGDVMMIANSICNPNSLHFLYNGKPLKYINTLSLMMDLKKALIEQHLPFDDFLIDSSSVMAIYGLRQANDLDYLNVKGDRIGSIKGIEEHDKEQRKFYSLPVSDLIYDHKHYFYFCNLKILSLRDLLLFKHARYNNNHDIKDRVDAKIIQLYLKDTVGIWSELKLMKIWMILLLMRIKNKLFSYGFLFISRAYSKAV